MRKFIVIALTGLGLVLALLVLAPGGALARRAAHKCQPRPHANLAGCRYAHRDLAGADFAGSNLTGARFIGTRLKGANFAHAKLTAVSSGGDRGRPVQLPKGWTLTRGYLIGKAANLTDARLGAVNLRGRSLPGTVLTWAMLNGADLAGADLRGSSLGDASLDGANVTGTNFHGANFAGVSAQHVSGTAAFLPNGWTQRAGDLVGPSVDLAWAALSGADLSQTNLTGANLTGSDLSGAILNESALAGASLGDANLANVSGIQLDLSGANLRGADLRAAELTDAGLTDADLTGAQLAGAQMTGAALQGAEVTGTALSSVSSGSMTGAISQLPADWTVIGGYLLGPGAALSGANLAAANLAGIDLASAGLANADLANANLTGVNLTGADLSSANLSGANLTDATISAANIGAAQLAGANLTGISASATTGTPATMPAGWAMVNETLTQVPSSIAATTYLNQGDWLESPNGAFTVDMQNDGNLVEYQGGTAIWATGTSGYDFAVMQSDCNFVIYNSPNTTPSAAIYTTGTGGDPNAGCTFAIANDGSLSVATAAGTVRWERYANGTIFTHRIVMTQNAPLENGPSTSSGQIDTIPTGQSPSYVCWTTGQVVNSVNVWFYVLWDGKAGYYPSGDDSSVYSTDSRISIDYGIPLCGSVPTTFTPPTNGSTGQPAPTTIKAPIAVTTTTNIRPGPSASSGSPLATMPAGSSPGFFCWTTGDVVNEVDVWFKVYWSGATGYYASGLDNSSYTTDAQITTKYGIPPCGGASGGGSSSGGSSAGSGGGGGSTTGSGGNASIEAAAATWARRQVGSSAWDYKCLAFVYQAWESAGVSRAKLDAIAGYSPNGNTYPIDEWRYWAGGHPPGGVWHSGFDPAPPNGAMIFYSNKQGDEDSHATISVGGGQMISPGITGVVGPVSVTYNPYASMLGWWMPK